ncbi:MAG: hypothetical protein ACR2PU_02345 [Gammaproteobacteria bacterium]
MPRFVSISKAALLASVPAKEIQNKINSKQLTITRGQIHIDDLVECFPEAHVDEADMLSLVAKIKEESFAVGAAKQHGEMSLQDMLQELHKLRASADYYHERSHKFEEIILYLRDNLEDMQIKIGKNQRIEGLIHWMDQRLKEIRRND